ncbi:myogenesis-regulating glycosidase-like [Gigantopelta aegis]|uniref:myogenesis-regulating glycosidase-like n=1 Tax=Gigantopelta aegis TaxID=1735272 RepID=UPI001B88D12F|nr:myogenesis-regulating glycosidase-like [Gigantopelta aegis]
MSLVVLGTLIGVLFWKLESHDHTVNFRVGDAQIVLQDKLRMTLKKRGEITGEGLLGFNIPHDSPEICSHTDASLCLTWEGDRKLVINAQTERDVMCYDVTWEALACASQELKDCFNLTFAHWYGGFEDFHQYWPINTIQKDLSPYVTNESLLINDTFGSVQDRYFVSSSGVGIHVDWDVPLYLSLNADEDDSICLAAKYDAYPYFNLDHTLPVLNYTICQADNVLLLHKFMSEKFISKPSDIPDKRMFESPIWSTWALYKKNISQSKVLDLAGNINGHGFSHAQIEIDDQWTVGYGDMDFDKSKFPDASSMIRKLNTDGFRVTLWIHPFFNTESNSFRLLADKGYLVRSLDSSQPAVVSWWDGNLAGVLDVTNEDAVDWYINQTTYLRNTYSVSSFKLDAGEIKWLPNMYSTSKPMINPNEFSKLWAEIGLRVDPDIRHQEVRVGAGNQSLPVFVRMLDKESSWGHSNGLKSLIPAALTFGLLGYPFVLPDMIGGNAYTQETEADTFPDVELFVRWVQLNAFLPSMQFSITPWNYNSTIVEISHHFVQLHEQYSSLFIKLAENAVATGEPIIRPLWWIAPDDDTALTIETEFLVGDKLLVAPILEEGGRSRDIYLPGGRWSDILRNKELTGGQWYKNYPADLHELPYFIKLD